MKSGKQTLESMGKARWYNHWLLSKFSRYLKGDILEVGSGIGNFTNELKKFGDVWAIDIDSDYLRLNSSERIGFGDIESAKYFFGKRQFDTLVCLNVLEHIQDDKKALSNLSDLLVSQGILILLVPSHQFLFGSIDKSIGHYRRYDKEKLTQILREEGFEVISNQRLNWLGAAGWAASKLKKDRYVKLGNIYLFNCLAPVSLFIEKFIEPPIGISILAIARKK